jgi:Leucine-rich repeat (LRR) protein
MAFIVLFLCKRPAYICSIIHHPTHNDMRYTISSLLLFGLFCTPAQAQNIPDANFATAIRQICPTCIDANNDLLAPATTLQILDVSAKNIQSLQGIQGFTNLQYLYCYSNTLTSLPALPISLQRLSCYNNALTSLPALPASLKRLSCYNNALTSLPALPALLEQLLCYSNDLTSLPTLPATLQFLSCGGNALTSLPASLANVGHLDCSFNALTSLPALPATLQYLYCDDNGLTSLPALPATLQLLSCGNNALTSLPALPALLEHLHCHNNGLTSLPVLPDTLHSLGCSSNSLTSLPALPVSLQELSCFYNNLTSLPALPATLQLLSCGNNALTSLPALPAALSTLHCQYNALTSLPALPASLEQLSCGNNWNLACLPILPSGLTDLETDVNCLPNIPIGITANNTLPVCQPSNPNNCDVFTQLNGMVYLDYNNTCAFDTLNDSTAAAGMLVKATNMQNPTTIFNTYTNANGQYTFTLPVGQYTIQAFPSLPNYYTPCSNAVVTITSASNFVSQNIGLQPFILCPAMQVEVDANFIRRCFTGAYEVSYRNIGTLAAQNAYIDIEFDSYLSYVSNTANISATSLGNNTYRFPVGNMGVSQQGRFQAVVSVSCNSVLGQVHCTNAQIFPNTPCGVNWNGAVISILDTCMVDSVVFRLVNSGSNMLASQTYSIVEDNLMYRPITAFQLNAGGTLDISIPTRPNRTYRIEVQQAPNYPALLGDSLAWAIVQNCNGISNTTASNPNIFNTQNAALAVSTDCTPNRGAYDPNQKTAQQIGYGSQHFILANTPLEYKIEFQNTGTDTAFRVVILDTLDMNVLDPANIQIGTSSHAFTWALLQNNILKFTFDNIQLVDSFTNEPLSHGYVTFNIAQQPNLAVNTVINNKAAIYFDYNAPIITNTCFHTIGTNFVPRVAVSVGEVLNKNISVKAYPNPFQTESTLEVVGAENQALTLKIVDAMGKTVQTQESQQSTLRISRENLPTGLYFYQLFGNGQLLNTGKLIAE